MTTLPTRSAITSSTTTNAEQKTNLGDQRDFLADLLGTDSGDKGAARLTLGLFSHGQCALALSGANLLLSPKNGNLLMVNGVACTVPDAGVTLAPTGLSATTRYYVYAVATAGVITSLEASTTAPSVDTAAGNKGVGIKTGDATRTLVGMAYCKTAATFADTAQQRFVLSYFNRRQIFCQGTFSVLRSTASGTYSEINVEIRCEFITWADEAVVGRVDAQSYNAAAGNLIYTAIALDSTSVATREVSVVQQAVVGPSGSVALPNLSFLSEAYHYYTLLGKVSASTGNWYPDTAVSVSLRG